MNKKKGAEIKIDSKIKHKKPTQNKSIINYSKNTLLSSASRITILQTISFLLFLAIPTLSNADSNRNQSKNNKDLSIPNENLHNKKKTIQKPRIPISRIQPVMVNADEINEDTSNPENRLNSNLNRSSSNSKQVREMCDPFFSGIKKTDRYEKPVLFDENSDFSNDQPPISKEPRKADARRPSNRPPHPEKKIPLSPVTHDDQAHRAHQARSIPKPALSNRELKIINDQKTSKIKSAPYPAVLHNKQSDTPNNPKPIKLSNNQKLIQPNNEIGKIYGENQVTQLYFPLIDNHRLIQGSINRRIKSIKLYSNQIACKNNYDTIKEEELESCILSNEFNTKTPFSIWSEVVGKSANFKNNESKAKTQLDEKTYGIHIGADIPLENGFAGLFAGYTTSHFTYNTIENFAQTENFSLSSYAATKDGPYLLKAAGGITSFDIAMPNIPIYNYDNNILKEFLNTSYKSMMFHVFSEASYDLPIEIILSKPFVRLSRVFMKNTDYEPSGNSLSLSGKMLDSGANFLTLGLEAEKELEIETQKILLKGMIGWQHAFGQLSPESQLKVEGKETNAKLIFADNSIPENTALFEAEVDIEVTPKLLFAFSLNSAASSEFYSHNANAGLRVDF